MLLHGFCHCSTFCFVAMLFEAPKPGPSAGCGRRPQWPKRRRHRLEKGPRLATRQEHLLAWWFCTPGFRWLIDATLFLGKLMAVSQLSHTCLEECATSAARAPRRRPAAETAMEPTVRNYNPFWATTSRQIFADAAEANGIDHKPQTKP